jgi:hypothetical protein
MINQIMNKVLMALGFLIAIFGAGIAAYGLFTEHGLSNMLVLGIIIMFIGAIIFIFGYETG